MQEEIGGPERIKALTLTLFDLIKADPRLSHFFHYTDIKKHACRIGQFLTYLAGGHEDWVGLSVDMAHAGRFISEEHFDLFMIYFK